MIKTGLVLNKTTRSLEFVSLNIEMLIDSEINSFVLPICRNPNLDTCIVLNSTHSNHPFQLSTNLEVVIRPRSKYKHALHRQPTTTWLYLCPKPSHIIDRI